MGLSNDGRDVFAYTLKTHFLLLLFFSAITVPIWLELPDVRIPFRTFSTSYQFHYRCGSSATYNIHLIFYYIRFYVRNVCSGAISVFAGCRCKLTSLDRQLRIFFMQLTIRVSKLHSLSRRTISLVKVCLYNFDNVHYGMQVYTRIIQRSPV